MPRRVTPSPTSATQLVLISFLALYWELAFIRWAPTQVRLLAYFSNYLLIAALFGIGLGMLLARKQQRLIGYFPAALFAVTFLILALERTDLVIPLVAEGQFVWNYLANIEPAGAISYGVIVALFLGVVGVFALIGQEVGLALNPFPSLRGYSLNIFGSLLGVLGFALVSYLETPPPVWFVVGVVLHAGYLLSLRGSVGRVVLGGALLVGVAVITFSDAARVGAGITRYWSPYYEIETYPVPGGEEGAFDLVVNKDSHQQARRLDGDSVGPALAGRQRLYDMPYAFNQPGQVLIVGAGTGNDAAAANRNAPDAQVDAVEIDPVIARLGLRHPEDPYRSPNVRVIVDDARSFVQRSTEKYDLIVFGFLDSHRLFSHMSSVRMDNYVYTREHFEQVRERLTPHGIVAVTFTVHEQWIADRLATLLDEVFGHPPLVYQSDKSGRGTLFLASASPLTPPPGAPLLDERQVAEEILQQRDRITWSYTDAEGFLPAGTLSVGARVVQDDWPFLYMRSASIPPNYVLVLALTALAALALVAWLVPKIDVRSVGNWRFLLLGVAFALLQTRGVTEVALIVGSTWTTNSIVISATLVMILLANLVVARWRVSLAAAYAGLFAVLLLNYLVPLQVVLAYDFAVQALFAGIRVGAPLFFAGIIFARYIREATNLSSALGANLIGAVIGGLLEYTSLMFGLRVLYLFALLFYGLAAVVTRLVLRAEPVGRIAAKSLE